MLGLIFVQFIDPCQVQGVWCNPKFITSLLFWTFTKISFVILSLLIFCKSATFSGFLFLPYLSIRNVCCENILNFLSLGGSFCCIELLTILPQLNDKGKTLGFFNFWFVAKFAELDITVPNLIDVAKWEGSISSSNLPWPKHWRWFFFSWLVTKTDTWIRTLPGTSGFATLWGNSLEKFPAFH